MRRIAGTISMVGGALGLITVLVRLFINYFNVGPGSVVPTEAPLPFIGAPVMNVVTMNLIGAVLALIVVMFAVHMRRDDSQRAGVLCLIAAVIGFPFSAALAIAAIGAIVYLAAGPTAGGDA